MLENDGPLVDTGVLRYKVLTSVIPKHILPLSSQSGATLTDDLEERDLCCTMTGLP
jgi:hypothetical protein